MHNGDPSKEKTGATGAGSASPRKYVSEKVAIGIGLVLAAWLGWVARGLWGM